MECVREIAWTRKNASFREDLSKRVSVFSNNMHQDVGELVAEEIIIR